MIPLGIVTKFIIEHPLALIVHVLMILRIISMKDLLKLLVKRKREKLMKEPIVLKLVK